MSNKIKRLPLRKIKAVLDGYSDNGRDDERDIVHFEAVVCEALLYLIARAEEQKK